MPEKDKKIAILCDFDGTITKQDVSDTAFTKWLGPKWEEIDQEWHDGKISMVELYERCWELVDVTEDELRAFVDTIEIDEFVPELLSLCESARIPVNLVSDGFNFFIDQIMKKHDLHEVEYSANKLWFHGDRIELSFDNRDEECIKCGNCKKAFIDEKRNEADFIIYIGNGLSDLCAAEHADLVFAKDSLLCHCRQQNMACIEYKTFADIIEYLKKHGFFAVGENE